MKVRRWRRSTEAKPDEIWTESIFHIPGLLVHAVPESRKKHAFMTGLYRNARCLSSCERTRDKWAQTGMSRRWFRLSRSPRCGGQQNTRSGACH